MSRHRRHLLAMLLAALVAVGTAAPVVAADPTPDPVLLVHGWRGDPSTWADMIARFKAAQPDRVVKAIDLPGEDNVVNAAAIRDFIAAEGWSRVDIVGHSMGGLSSRHYVKGLGPTVVDTYVSLGTPQYGIYSACLLPQRSGGQMCPWSSFLRTLNSGDDTPPTASTPPVYWTTIYSTSDRFVPNSSSRLDGGACHVRVSGVSHNSLDNDAAVFGHVLASVDRQPCTGEMRT